MLIQTEMQTYLLGLQQLEDCEMGGLQNDEEQTNASLFGKSSVNLA